MKMIFSLFLATVLLAQALYAHDGPVSEWGCHIGPPPQHCHDVKPSKKTAMIVIGILAATIIYIGYLHSKPDKEAEQIRPISAIDAKMAKPRIARQDSLKGYKQAVFPRIEWVDKKKEVVGLWQTSMSGSQP